MNEPKIEKLPLSQCLAMRHPKNPKDHSLDKLIESFGRFGFVAFPTIDEASQTMVAGHGRCEALAKLRETGKPPPAGIVEVGTEWMVPVIRGIAFANERERDAYLIADNAQAQAGGWRFDLLTEMIGELSEESNGLVGLGFETTELDSLLGNYVPEPPSAGDVPPPGDQQPSVTHDISVQTTYRCPNCKHEWTGKPR